jgi:predicted DNA-binding transcriptional regulator YafY
LVRLLLLLQTRGKMTAAALADELEVSVRTVYRDLEALSGAGVPVYAEAGPGGGCQLLSGYRSPLTRLSTTEAEALLAAAPGSHLAELGLGTALVDAQLKVLAELPEPLRARAQAAAQRFHLDTAGWFRASTTPPQLSQLVRAVWEDRLVEVDYGRRDGTRRTRVVEPLGLVVKAGIWYLVGRTDGALRTYRVSRMGQIRVDDATFDRPEVFDLRHYWETWAAEFEAGLPHVEVVVRLRPEAIPRLRAAVDARFRDQVQWDTPKAADGRQTVTVVFERVAYAQGPLLAMGGQVEVVAPAELRQALADAGERLRAAHAGVP